MHNVQCMDWYLLSFTSLGLCFSQTMKTIYPYNICRYLLDQISSNLFSWAIWSSTHIQQFMIPNQQDPYYEHDDITIENSPGIDSFLETKILVSQVQQIQLNPFATWFVPLRQQEIQHDEKNRLDTNLKTSPHEGTIQSSSDGKEPNCPPIIVCQMESKMFQTCHLVIFVFQHVFDFWFLEFRLNTMSYVI